MSETAMSHGSVVIFGASGDLTRRKLGPALYRLHVKGRLPEGTRVVGFARRAYDDESFRAVIQQSLQEFTDEFEQQSWDTFAPRLHYVQGDLEDLDACRRLHARLDELEDPSSDRLYYLAVAPRFFAPAIDLLGRAAMASEEHGRRNLIIEKPFGRDAASAAQLDDAVHAVFSEHQVFRIDHYLGKETAQNLLYFRFANTIFEPIWNRTYVDNIQITVAESVDVGHRAGYYDHAGVLRDMFQNHLLQLFTLVAMEPPAPFNATTLRDEKVKVLSATRPVDLETTVCGQYEGYRATEGVADGSRTPTYAALRLQVDNWRWQGVPFYLRSGKAMAEKTSTVSIEFKRPPHRMFGAFQSPTPNVLSLCIQPDEGIHLEFDAKVPDQTSETKSVEMEFHYSSAFPGDDLPDAYERLLLDAIRSDASLFLRSDEIARAWHLMDPVIDAWHAPDGPSIARYQPGSWGPAEADDLLAQEQRGWHEGCATRAE